MVGQVHQGFLLRHLRREIIREEGLDPIQASYLFVVMGNNVYMLYLSFRKLLNQMIDYDQAIPPFTEDVNSKNLGDQLAPLWMCYW